ncbi:MAG: c-type cytochrome biogenesis protein CcmI [Caulobacter sp.]|nr:c-type cytochrome biogenesis protein CcmI [Caulobacter sp.]
MIFFWVIAAGLSAAAGGLVLLSAQKMRQASSVVEDPAVSLLRRQMSEIDDLVARGLLDSVERDGSRAEAARRLLSAAERPARQRKSGGDRVVLAAAVLAPAAAVALYLFVGSPGTPDATLGSRVAAWRAADPSTLTAGQIAAVLTEVSRERPADPELLRNLALARQGAGDPYGAAKALRQAVAVKPGDPVLWSLLGEAFMTLSDGRIGVDARRAFGEALKLQPSAPAPRYFLARARVESGDVAGGLADWKALLSDLPDDDARRAGLAAEIASVQQTGKLDVDGSAPSGPQPGNAGSGEVGAAIRNMVAGLASRLKGQPDDPDGWARLIRAYAVLGETEKQAASMARAQQQFKGRPDVLLRLKTASEAPQ